VVVLAQDEARRLDHNYVGTEHILLGLLAESGGVAAKSLQTLGISLQAVAAGGRADHRPRPAETFPAHPPDAARQEGPRAVTARGAAARPQLHRHRAHPARPDPRGWWRGRPGADPARRRARPGRAAILQLLAGHQSGRSEPAPPALRDYDEKSNAARQQKDAALDAGDLDRAAALREEEQRLLEEQARRLEEWSSGVDVAALAQEAEQLRQEVARLRNLLLRHNIQPDEGQQQTP